MALQFELPPPELAVRVPLDTFNENTQSHVKTIRDGTINELEQFSEYVPRWLSDFFEQSNVADNAACGEDAKRAIKRAAEAIRETCDLLSKELMLLPKAGK